MNASATGVDGEGEGKKVVAAPTVGIPRVILNDLAASKMKKVVIRLEQWEIDDALAMDVSDYVSRLLPGSPTHQDPKLEELRDHGAKTMGLVQEWHRQYQALVRQEYEAKGYVDMEFVVPVPIEEYLEEGKYGVKKDEKAQ
jgi:hypothetical protein